MSKLTIDVNVLVRKVKGKSGFATTAFVHTVADGKRTYIATGNFGGKFDRDTLLNRFRIQPNTFKPTQATKDTPLKAFVGLPG